MTAAIAPLTAMADKLALRGTMTADDRAAVFALPFELQVIAAGAYIVRDGYVATHSCLLRSGFAFREKLTGDGRRQICAIHIMGDMVDLQNSLLRIADHSVVALTQVDVAFVPREAVLDLAFSNRAVGEALWFDTLVDGSIFREWTTSIGQRDARARLAHLLCEFALRFEVAGLGAQHSYELPMTQGHLADCTGLTPVHVNRTLKSLRDEGLVSMTRRSVTIENWPALAEAGDFDSGYLHLPQERAEALRR